MLAHGEDKNADAPRPDPARATATVRCMPLDPGSRPRAGHEGDAEPGRWKRFLEFLAVLPFAAAVLVVSANPFHMRKARRAARRARELVPLAPPFRMVTKIDYGGSGGVDLSAPPGRTLCYEVTGTVEQITALVMSAAATAEVRLDVHADSTQRLRDLSARVVDLRGRRGQERVSVVLREGVVRDRLHRYLRTEPGKVGVEVSVDPER